MTQTKLILSTFIYLFWCHTMLSGANANAQAPSEKYDIVLLRNATDQDVTFTFFGNDDEPQTVTLRPREYKWYSRKCAAGDAISEPNIAFPAPRYKRINGHWAVNPRMKSKILQANRAPRKDPSLAKKYRFVKINGELELLAE